MKTKETIIMVTVQIIMTIGLTYAAPIEYVDVDIKPQSCPNPVNVKSKGVIIVAILGSEDFNVLDVDIATITLGGVSPTRSSFKDVSTSSYGDECKCITEGPDGYLDLTLKFRRKDIFSAIEGFLGNLSEIEHRTDIQLYLIAQLMDEETTIEGTDYVRILNRTKAKKEK